MKIGILTLPLYTNYGGILQAYALQTILKRMGHEVCLIEKRRKVWPPFWKMPFVYGKRIAKNMLGQPTPIFKEQKIYSEMSVIKQDIDQFINKYIKRRIVDSFSEIKDTDFDMIIVGSDQIWRPPYFNNIESAYLDFTYSWNIKRAAYAASFGIDKWEYSPKQTERCKLLLKQFDAVSIREDSGVNLCHQYLDREAQQMLDPTMLLRERDYIQLFEKANVISNKGKLLNYILDETSEKRELINKIAKDKGLKPYSIVSFYNGINSSLKSIYPSIEQWLKSFYDAEFVVTDSFHGCVFSILFNKPFIAYGNKTRGLTRFTSLLKTFNLNDRLITNPSTTLKQITDINWNSVNSILTEKRNEAKKFLCNI